MSEEITDIQYSPEALKDVKVILITAPYIDQLNPEELKRYMAWINARYGGEKIEG